MVEATNSSPVARQLSTPTSTSTSREKQKKLITTPNSAAKSADAGNPTLFDKIVAKEIPADVIFEDDKCLGEKGRSPPTLPLFSRPR